MSDLPPTSAVDAEALLQSLRRKEGTWVEWGQACQTLQKSGHSPQAIFEATGFEPIQQNQIIVAAQVYATLVVTAAPEAVQAHFQQRGSDILYELRVLTQEERAEAAALIWAKKLDVDGAREVVRALKDYGRLPELPKGFSRHPGDAMAHQYWKQARQQPDLQARSRLIGQAFTYVHSEAARHQIEQLLTDFTVVAPQKAPYWPLYRLDSEEELPRILPVVGKLPLTPADLQATPWIEAVAPFQLVSFQGSGVWVAIPGWQVILNAADPVALLCDSERLPTPLPGAAEELLLVVDRAERQWSNEGYFLSEQDDQLIVQWFPETPMLPILGRVVLVMRPRKVLIEAVNQDPWQVDE
ncbi:hypothetical protein DO97_04160 [Neosynechococcus sphagnicola sy1]|uniref:RuBisCO accumulation factor 1 n=1 Tax=Neosynechococcus sphagnicola sy1 TaxID=1497020 RepID=A0A098TKN9_9CYAN|nr:RuBisCO accumulation factor 1 [Neosynechococcus sphagnicola]KGF72900.1 hypothetical protein DO97_04160 [Neosynechococcus sphagnicola sy1]